MANHLHAESLGTPLVSFLGRGGGRVELALLAFVGYYLGALLGLALTFPPLVISVLWPPNAILFAAMMLVEPRLWWVIVAGAFPAHLLSELDHGIPPMMVMSWFVSNVAEAMIGAKIVRAFVGSANPFATLRGVGIFALGAVASAVLSSFLDSALVKLNGWGSTGYWELVFRRLLSNVTADFVVAAVVFTWASRAVEWMRGKAPARGDEALAFYAVFAILTIVIFNTSFAASAPAAQVCLPIPFLLVAAFRFGMPGTTASFAVVALITIWGAGHGIGALATPGTLDSTRSVQLYLLCIGPTIFCMAAVIEERRAVDASLRISDKRFRLVLRATHDIVYEQDVGTGALSWSHDGPARYGYSRRHDLRTFAAFAGIIHDDDRERVVRERHAALLSDETGWDTEFRLRRSNGLYSDVRERGFIVRDVDGRPLQVIAAITDTSEARNAEEMSERLAHVSRLTSMGELAASIAHEINQPISAILNNLDSADVLLASGRTDAQELRDILADIRTDDVRAGDIVRHIRELANKREALIEPFDMNQLVETSVRIALPAARKRGIQLQSRPGAIPFVVGDRIHVQQVLLNLTFNAMDAMAETPREHRVVVVTTASLSPTTVEVSVRDRGHGIAREHIEKIFDSFFTTKRDGMGLGLSIARTLIHAQGGRIRAKNNAEGGATVAFSLPANRFGPRQPT